MCIAPNPQKKMYLYIGARNILAEKRIFFNWHMPRMHFCDWLCCTDCAKDFAICTDLKNINVNVSMSSKKKKENSLQFQGGKQNGSCTFLWENFDCLCFLFAAVVHLTVDAAKACNLSSCWKGTGCTNVFGVGCWRSVCVMGRQRKEIMKQFKL